MRITLNLSSHRPGCCLQTGSLEIGRAFLICLPLKPKGVRFGAVNGLSSHGFARLPKGHIVATFQGHGPDNQPSGGLAELDDQGQPLRSASSADPSADLETLPMSVGTL